MKTFASLDTSEIIFPSSTKVILSFLNVLSVKIGFYRFPEKFIICDPFYINIVVENFLCCFEDFQSFTQNFSCFVVNIAIFIRSLFPKFVKKTGFWNDSIVNFFVHERCSVTPNIPFHHCLTRVKYFSHQKCKFFIVV